MNVRREAERGPQVKSQASGFCSQVNHGAIHKDHIRCGVGDHKLRLRMLRQQ